MDLMSIATNKVVLAVAGVVVWTFLVWHNAYNAGFDERDAQCQKEAKRAAHAAIADTKSKLDAQAILYEDQVAQARMFALQERAQRKKLEGALDDIRNTPAPDCSAIPAEWVQSVQQAWSFTVP